MKKGLQKILNEFNPKHDFDRVGFLSDWIRSHKNESISKLLTKAIINSAYFAANGLSKHVLRYGLPAAGLGALTAYFIGEDPKIGAILVGTSAALVDTCQYAIHGMVIPTFDRIINPHKYLENSLKNQVNGNAST